MKAECSRYGVGFSRFGCGYASTFLRKAICPTLIFYPYLPPRDLPATKTHLMIAALLYFFLSGALAYFITRRSAVSFGWGYFFSYCFSPLIGLLIARRIGKYGNSKKKPFTASGIQCLKVAVCVLAGIFLVYISIKNWPSLPDVYNIQDYQPGTVEYLYYQNYKSSLNASLFEVSVGIGLLGNVIYIISNADTYVSEYETINANL